MDTIGKNNFAEGSPDKAKNSCVTRRRYHISIRLTWEEYKRLEGLAKLLNQTVSETVRNILFGN